MLFCVAICARKLTATMFDLTRRSRGWIWGCRLSALDLHRIYCSSLRISDVDGGEAAELPYALLLVFLRGNAPDTGCLSLPPAFQWFGLGIFDEIRCEGAGYCLGFVVVWTVVLWWCV